MYFDIRGWQEECRVLWETRPLHRQLRDWRTGLVSLSLRTVSWFCQLAETRHGEVFSYESGNHQPVIHTESTNGDSCCNSENNGYEGKYEQHNDRIEYSSLLAMDCHGCRVRWGSGIEADTRKMRELCAVLRKWLQWYLRYEMDVLWTEKMMRLTIWKERERNGLKSIRLELHVLLEWVWTRTDVIREAQDQDFIFYTYLYLISRMLHDLCDYNPAVQAALRFELCGFELIYAWMGLQQ